MKRTLLLSTIIFFLFFIPALSQEDKKSSYLRNQFGIQFNPYINQQFIDFRNMSTVAALRFGYRIKKNITTGMEFSCNFPINTGSDKIFNYFKYNIGLFGKYSILAEKRFQIFAEASPYLSHYYKEWTSSSDHSAFRDNKLGYYAAPGITLYSKSKKISFDLYYKFSNLRTLNGNKSVLSYKVNYNF